MLCRAHAVTAVTEGVRDALIEKGVDPSRIVWLPNGADTMMFSPGPPREDIVERYGGQPGESMFLYAGTHGYVHGLEVLLDAAALLAGEPVRIVFVGDGSEKDALKQRSADLALDNVTFLDPVSPAEVADLLRCATGALVSVRGGDVYRTIRSAKAIPAMSSGRPVIYSGDDEGSSLIEEIGAGLVTPPGDPEAVAAAIRLLMAEPGLRDALGSKGRSWVVAHASWQQLVGDWLEQLNRLDQPSGLAGGLR